MGNLLTCLMTGTGLLNQNWSCEKAPAWPNALYFKIIWVRIKRPIIFTKTYLCSRFLFFGFHVLKIPVDEEIEWKEIFIPLTRIWAKLGIWKPASVPFYGWRGKFSFSGLVEKFNGRLSVDSEDGLLVGLSVRICWWLLGWSWVQICRYMEEWLFMMAMVRYDQMIYENGNLVRKVPI